MLLRYDLGFPSSSSSLINLLSLVCDRHQGPVAARMKRVFSPPHFSLGIESESDWWFLSCDASKRNVALNKRKSGRLLHRLRDKAYPNKKKGVTLQRGRNKIRGGN